VFTQLREVQYLQQHFHAPLRRIAVQRGGSRQYRHKNRCVELERKGEKEREEGEGATKPTARRFFVRVLFANGKSRLDKSRSAIECRHHRGHFCPEDITVRIIMGLLRIVTKIGNWKSREILGTANFERGNQITSERPEIRSDEAF